MEYAIKVSIINQDGDKQYFEIVPSLSYEQGAEALARLLKKVENQQEPLEDNE